MTVQDIIDELSDHGFTDTSTTRKVWMVNDSVWDICSREPWPFLEKTLALTFDGINAVPSNWPTDFRSVVDIIDTSTGLSLEPLRLDQVDKLVGSDQTTVGTPQAYYFINGQAFIYQVPATGYSTLRMRYLALHPTLLSTSVETDIRIPLQHHRAITLGCLWKLYDMEDDVDLAARFEQHYENRIATMRDEIWMKQYDRPDRITIIDSDDVFDTWYLT